MIALFCLLVLAQAQLPPKPLCRVQLSDSTIVEVAEGKFNHPDFCNKQCTCTISYPDIESGVPLHTVACGCQVNGGDGQDYCFTEDEYGFVPGSRGVCQCRDNNGLPTLYCGLDPSEAPPGLEQAAGRNNGGPNVRSGDASGIEDPYLAGSSGSGSLGVSLAAMLNYLL